MSFCNVLERLRKAAAGQQGRKDNCIILISDLRELLHNFDRLDLFARSDTTDINTSEYIMSATEKRILVLRLEYKNTEDSVAEIIKSLDAKYGKYNYSIINSGPKHIGAGKCDPILGLMTIHVDQ